MTTYYWIGGSGFLTSSMTGAHLSLSSGGAAVSGTVIWSQANAHSLIIDQNSGSSGMGIKVSSLVIAIKDFDASAAPSMTMDDSGSIQFLGSVSMNSGMTFAVTSSFIASGDQSLTTGGATFSRNIGISLTGTFSLLDAFNGSTANHGFVHKSGVFDTHSNNITVATFAPSTTPSALREVHLGASVVTLTGQQLGVWDVTGSATVDAVNATIKLTGAPTINGINFKGGGFNYGSVVFQNGPGSVRISGANNFTSLSFEGQATYSLVDAQAAGSLSADAGINRLGIQSSVSGTQRTLTAQAVSVLNNIDFKDIDAEGPTIPWSGTGLGDLGNNSNITF